MNGTLGNDLEKQANEEQQQIEVMDTIARHPTVAVPYLDKFVAWRKFPSPIESWLCVIGMVTGMSQSWWVGPIALRAGSAPFGGDLGFELGFGFASASYCVFRMVELRVFKR
ncbi:hypothetical protein GMDG_05549 [Pseudogymnoascus destructans 20631-21]|uniref:Uncharacterized protein n=1 Tax=Pseudogymnoascus destructans (strain ATCC MYA-4855 / 20631-21) TaxID=658429 RepID=L8FQ33_PSED2|nr:hypothetical protein GMDG_05549 [Pseudogymnoascus destructans 20631-21]